MSTSPFFHNLGTAYQAELEDLSFDSEGRDVLRQRLADKRRELGFLRQMIELSPEMVAVVFHQGFQFKQPQRMEQLVSEASEDLPAWASLADAVTLQSWAQPLSLEILKEPMGDWFLTVAAGLEYLYGKPGKAPASAADSDDQDGDEDTDRADDRDADGDGDSDDGNDGVGRHEAGEDWLAEQGFDRKD
ncbi:MAG: hypothetical protein RIS90_732 [Pseudomonadota bacterium]